MTEKPPIRSGDRVRVGHLRGEIVSVRIDDTIDVRWDESNLPTEWLPASLVERIEEPIKVGDLITSSDRVVEGTIVVSYIERIGDVCCPETPHVRRYGGGDWRRLRGVGPADVLSTEPVWPQLVIYVPTTTKEF